MRKPQRRTLDAYSLRDLLRDAIRSNPRASEAEIRDIMWQTVRNERGYTEPLFDYYFPRNYKRFRIIENESGTIMHEIHLRRRQSNESEVRIETDRIKMKISLMHHVLSSSGKEAEASTFGDALNEGGFWAAVGKQGRANEVIGKKLTEKDLLSLRARFEKKP